MNDVEKLKEGINEVLNAYSELASSFKKSLEETTKKIGERMKELGLEIEDVGKGLSSIVLLMLARLEDACHFLRDLIAQTSDPEVIDWILKNTVMGKEAFIDKEFELRCPFCGMRIPSLSFSLFLHFVKCCNIFRGRST
jgi:hypothetical protein